MSMRFLSLALICSLALVCPVSHLSQSQTGLPDFLVVGSFAQYRQEFSTGEVYELRWEIVSIEDNAVEIETRSRGLLFNTTTNSFDIVPGGGTLVIDENSWEIQVAYYTNGTEIAGYPAGEKMAFWISSETNESTLINTMYDRNVYPILTDPLVFDCLSSTRTCWMTRNVYSNGNQMDRYYDQETGIVLMIETQRTVSSVEINVFETLNDTNIDLLTTNQIDGDSRVAIAALLIVLPVIILVALTIHFREKK
jgi:hypothetical protein